jgi:Cu+-exporting ATPase
VKSAAGVAEADLLRFGASLERASEHPLARAIVKGAEKRGASLTKPEEFSSLTGRGVTGRVDGKKVALGNRKLLDELGVDAAALHSRADFPAESAEAMS